MVLNNYPIRIPRYLHSIQMHAKEYHITKVLYCIITLLFVGGFKQKQNEYGGQRPRGLVT